MGINESFGIAEFQNKEYFETVESILSQLNHNLSTQKIIPEISQDILFNELIVDFSKVTSWLNKLTIYYNIDDFEDCYELTESLAISADQYTTLKNYVDIREYYIEKYIALYNYI